MVHALPALPGNAPWQSLPATAPSLAGSHRQAALEGSPAYYRPQTHEEFTGFAEQLGHNSYQGSPWPGLDWSRPARAPLIPPWNKRIGFAERSNSRRRSVTTLRRFEDKMPVPQLPLIRRWSDSDNPLPCRAIRAAAHPRPVGGDPHPDLLTGPP